LPISFISTLKSQLEICNDICKIIFGDVHYLADFHHQWKQN